MAGSRARTRRPGGAPSSPSRASRRGQTSIDCKAHESAALRGPCRHDGALGSISAAVALLVRRTAFVEVHGFDEAYFLYAEDVDLCHRLRERGWKCIAIPQTWAHTKVVRVPRRRLIVARWCGGYPTGGLSRRTGVALGVPSVSCCAISASVVRAGGWCGMDDVSVVATVFDEPTDRLERLLASLAAQEDVGSVEFVIATPIRDSDRFGLAPHGVVTKVVVVDNPSGDRSSGLNRAIAATTRPIVCRADARSSLGRKHLALCHERLIADAEVGIVGGMQLPVPGGRSVVARGIARALANPWLLGGAKYRRRGAGGPADTVYLGCFRRAELEALGAYDERLAANEDFDLAQRYRQTGQVVWLEEGLEVPYEPRYILGGLFSRSTSPLVERRSGTGGFEDGGPTSVRPWL